MSSNRKSKSPSRKLSHDGRLLLMALLAGVPAVSVALILLWRGDHSSELRWTLTFFVLGVWLGFAFALRERVVFPLRTLSNLLSALREGDYSMRARVARPEDALGERMLE